MPIDRTIIVPSSPELRSRVTNGKTLFAEGGDMRGPWARRLRDVLSLHVSDLGGPDAISEAKKSILRRVAAITVELERLEAEFSVKGATTEKLDLYQRTAGTLRRLLESVGLDRQSRSINDLTKRLREIDGTTNGS